MFTVETYFNLISNEYAVLPHLNGQRYNAKKVLIALPTRTFKKMSQN